MSGKAWLLHYAYFDAGPPESLRLSVPLEPHDEVMLTESGWEAMEASDLEIWRTPVYEALIRRTMLDGLRSVGYACLGEASAAYQYWLASRQALTPLRHGAQRQEVSEDELTSAD